VVEPVDDEVTLVEMRRVCGVEAVVLVTDMKGFAVLPGVLDPHSSATAESSEANVAFTDCSHETHA